MPPIAQRLATTTVQERRRADEKHSKSGRHDDDDAPRKSQRLQPNAMRSSKTAPKAVDGQNDHEQGASPSDKPKKPDSKRSKTSSSATPQTDESAASRDVRPLSPRSRSGVESLDRNRPSDTGALKQNDESPRHGVPAVDFTSPISELGRQFIVLPDRAYAEIYTFLCDRSDLDFTHKQLLLAAQECPELEKAAMIRKALLLLRWQRSSSEGASQYFQALRSSGSNESYELHDQVDALLGKTNRKEVAQPPPSLLERQRQGRSNTEARGEFFKPGRVIAILEWESLATIKTAGHHDGKRSYLRYFVVVKSLSDSCLCVPIRSYGGSGVPPSSPDAQSHAIIHIRGTEPEKLRGEPLLSKRSLVVIPANGEQLDRACRLCFHMPETIRYTTRQVADIGMVTEDCIPLLKQYLLECL